MAARTAASAPLKRTHSAPSIHADAAIGSGWPPQRLSVSMASACGIAKRSVASQNGIGSTFSDTCTIKPSVPSAPAIRRETS